MSKDLRRLGIAGKTEAGFADSLLPDGELCESGRTSLIVRQEAGSQEAGDNLSTADSLSVEDNFSAVDSSSRSDRDAFVKDPIVDPGTGIEGYVRAVNQMSPTFEEAQICNETIAKPASQGTLQSGGIEESQNALPGRVGRVDEGLGVDAMLCEGEGVGGRLWECLVWLGEEIQLRRSAMDQWKKWTMVS